MNIAELLTNKINTNQLVLTEFESKELLKEIGIQVPEQILTSAKEETIAPVNAAKTNPFNPTGINWLINQG